MGIQWQFLVTGLVVGAGLITALHLLKMDQILALKASKGGKSSTKGVGKAVGKIAGADNSLVGGVGIGVGLPLTAEDEVKFWAAHRKPEGQRTDTI
jgi:hypothetical protein